MATKKTGMSEATKLNLKKKEHQIAEHWTGKKKGSGSNQKNAASQLRSKRSWKMDFVRISSHPGEIRFVRLRFYKEIGYGTVTRFEHPTRAEIMTLKKRFKNMRVHIYKALQDEFGYSMQQIRIS